jgi:N-acetylneuraminic acid mutarotase
VAEAPRDEADGRQAPGIIVDLGSTYVIRVPLDRDETTRRDAVYRVDKLSWSRWWDEVAPGLDEHTVEALPVRAGLPGTSPVAGAAAQGASCAPFDTWRVGALDVQPKTKSNHLAVWTGSLMLVWGGGDAGGYRYDPVIDTWGPISTVEAPPVSTNHVGAWTGTEMIVWDMHARVGGRYDPLTDTWAPMTSAGSPEPRFSASVVWTGDEMILWGGMPPDERYQLGNGGRYDPSADSWLPTSDSNAPSARTGHTAVWTGSEMVVWGGDVTSDGMQFTPLNTGARYDPDTDSWNPTSTAVPVPSGRSGHIAVWTGARMVVWSGLGGVAGNRVMVSSGGRYDPSRDTWDTLNAGDAPTPRNGPAVWTGAAMFVWGGTNDSTGGLDDPVGDAWQPTSLVGAAAPRRSHSMVWTGTQAIVWGGTAQSAASVSAGGRYDPVEDAWTPTAVGGPDRRQNQQAVWTGSLMIITGGEASVPSYPWRYDPLLDSWTPTATDGAPQGAGGTSGQSAVWTGSEMIVWGRLSSGRYDPIADAWTPVSTEGAPEPRYAHTAVWTGTEMIIWGGYSPSGATRLKTGGRYNPAADAWEETATAGAPIGRALHSAVWTGSEMIVWGGDVAFQLPPTASGSRYNPASNSWLLDPRILAATLGPSLTRGKPRLGDAVAITTPLRQVGRVQPLAPQDRPDLAGPLRAINLAQDAQLVLCGEPTALRLRLDGWIGHPRWRAGGRSSGRPTGSLRISRQDQTFPHFHSLEPPRPLQ